VPRTLASSASRSSLAVGTIADGAARGASPGPNACRSGDYRHVYRQDATRFATQRDCTAYAAAGGRPAQFKLAVSEIELDGTDRFFTPAISGFGLQPDSWVRVTMYTAGGEPAGWYGAGVVDGSVTRAPGEVRVGCGGSGYVVGTAVTAEGAMITLAPIPTPWCSA